MEYMGMAVKQGSGSVYIGVELSILKNMVDWNGSDFLV
jgi:hypothetical protein